ncbi:hypothetical protein SHKM778_83980 [Streptomyces sp. KM77-8]|uniref:DUF4328 domain-containing protein n=1 Tax=Streptomyces haneummycinicus TaxID=3074435 RepID=A0AAT9HX35_9ACTN
MGCDPRAGPPAAATDVGVRRGRAGPAVPDPLEPSKDPDQDGVWGLVNLVNYVFPFGAPPYPVDAGVIGPLESTWAEDAVGPLWYLRAYLWFVFASPLLLWLFRRAPGRRCSRRSA